MSTVLVPPGERRYLITRVSIRSAWSGTASVSLATFGVAIGLGGAWRLPALLDQRGGGAFLLVYIGALVVIGLPLLMAELMIGRRGRANATGCYDRIAREEGRPCRWRWIAAAGGVAGVLLLAGGSELAAQAVILLVRSTARALAGTPGQATGLLPQASITQITQVGFFAVLGMIAVARTATRAKAEVTVTVLAVALLLVLSAGVLGADLTIDGIGQLLRPQFGRLGWSGAAEAIRLALLTLGLTLGMGLAHGAALPGSRSILRTSMALLLLVVGVTVLVLLLIATALHPYQMPPLDGRALLLGQIPAVLGGEPEAAVSAAWYALVALAGAAGGLAVLHSVVEQLVGRYGLRRRWGVVCAVGSAWVLSLLARFTGAPWAGPALLRSVATDVLVPGATLGLAIFAGWAMSRRATRSELGMRRPAEFRLWRVLVRYVTPAVLALVLVAGVARLIAG